MTERVLNILVVDDDVPNGSVASLKSFLVSSLGAGNAEVDHPATFDKGDSFLKSLTIYDLILFDINLGEADYKWSGIKLFDTHWHSIQAKGSKIMIYSGKPDAIDAYGHFSSGQGPFLFQARQDATSPGEAFERSIIRLLRERVRILCQRASLKSALEVAQGKSSTVSIEEEEWKVESLLAPWLFRLPGEVERSVEAAKLALFPSDALVRVLSYWFKARSFSWPSNSMYGLRPLTTYHFGVLTSPLDALMHDPWSNRIKACFGEASVAALHDHEILKDRLHPQFNRDLDSYINTAKSWTRITGVQEVEDKVRELKRKVEFKIPQILSLIKEQVTKTLVIDTAKVAGISGFEFYCPPYCLDSGESEPLIFYALRALAKSVSERAAKSLGLTFDYDGVLYSSSKPAELPYLLISIYHDGPPCAPNESIYSWFQNGHKGHDLFEAKNSLAGCAQWYVLSGKHKHLESYETPMDPGTLLREEADTLWARFNPDGRWNIVHVLKFGFPSIEDGNV